MNILVYSGPESLKSSLKESLSTLRSLVTPHFTVQTITPETLASHPWSTGCALLVLPGCYELNPSPSILIIRRYVEEDGGKCLMFSSGATFSSSSSTLDSFSSLSLSSSSKNQMLRFFDKTTNTYLYPKFHTGGEDASSSSLVSVQLTSGEGAVQIPQLGSKDFVGAETAKSAEILAKAGDKVTAVQCRFNKGVVAIWGAGIEFPTSHSNSRLNILRRTLEGLGLQIPSENVASTSHPMPQYLSASPSKPSAVSRVIEALMESKGTPLKLFEDKNDTFEFHELEDSDGVLNEGPKSDVQPDPATWQPKHVIVCRDGTLPRSTQTPLFDITRFFEELSASRKKHSLVNTSDSDGWGIGEVLLYSEVVTSTQTMIDKNPRFMTSLPTPLLSLASHQLTGRGRGANVWLSPSGCLQFSLLVRTSLTTIPAPKVVFVQYLFGLAVAEACREEAILGNEVGERVRLKWPNDLYAVIGAGDRDRKKIGGILVNTSFTGNQVDIVIGCGLNVLNPPPITSLNQLLTDRTAKQLSMERIAATVMAVFESMWSTFISHGGSFDPFMDLYLKRWLHSDQLVTLTTTNPPKAVRITGITPDHGLLRTIPERTGWGGEEEGFVDLQPDGNSFDMMAGLIKSKTQ